VSIVTDFGTPQAIFVCGVPASGKTSFGRALARRMGWAILDLDTVTNPLFEHIGGEFLVDVPTSDTPVRASVNDIRYKCLFDTAAENLSVGVNVVVIAPFTSERTFESVWASVPMRLGVTFEQVHLAWMDTDANDVVKRMKMRGADRDRDKIAHPDIYLTADVMRPPGAPHWRIDGSDSPDNQVRRFLEEHSAQLVSLSH
jgi:predicted kinase